VDNALLLLGGIAVVAGIITLLDWVARRKDRQSRNRAASAAIGGSAARNPPYAHTLPNYGRTLAGGVTPFSRRYTAIWP